MTERPTTDLDAFETALLAELKEEVRQRADLTPATPRTTERRPRVAHRRRWIAAAATAATTLVIVTQVPGLGPTPAYAVTGRNGGKVEVRVNRLEGAEGLEQALGERGIPADITYLPPGKECRAGRYTERRTPGMMLGVARDWFEVTIPPGAVGDGDTFVLSASVMPSGTGFRATTEFGVADGKVETCQVIDSP